MASKAERLRKIYEIKLGEGLVSKLSDDQIKLISKYYNSLDNTSDIDSKIMQGYSNTELHEMARGLIGEAEEEKAAAGALAVVDKKKFFGEDKYDKYYQELISEGRISGDNVSPDERKEGVKKYRKGKIDFKNFVDKVVEQKNSSANVKESDNTKSISGKGGSLAYKKKNIKSKNFIPPNNTEENLDEILKSIDSIRETLKTQKSVKDKELQKQRRSKEVKTRKSSEDRLEKSAFNGLGKVVSKAITPFKSIFDRLIDFIGTVLLGNIVLKLVDWFSDSKNKEKLDAIGTFLSKTWPGIIGAFLIFGNGLGRFATRMIAMTLRFIPKIAMAIGKLALAHPIAAAAILATGGAIIATQMNKSNRDEENKDDDKSTVTPAETRETGETPSGSQLQKELILQRGLGSMFSGGGKVPGSGNSDTVPAMLTPGEFVMSKGAVKEYGTSTLASMNTMGGGTNRPMIKDGTTYANTGGSISSGESMVGAHIFGGDGVLASSGTKSNKKPQTKPSTEKVEASAGGYGVLLDLIGKRESDSVGGYNAVNQGGADGGHTALGYSGDYRKAPFNSSKRSLTEMTIKEIMDLQYDDRSLSDSQWKKSGKLHAVGRYQIIGDTLKGLIDQGVASPEEKFTPSVQNKLGVALIKGTGGNVSRLKSTWIGLQHESDSTVASAVSAGGDMTSGGNALGGGSGGSGSTAKKIDWSTVKGFNIKSAEGTNQGIASGSVSTASLGKNSSNVNVPPPPNRSESNVSTVSAGSNSSEESDMSPPPNSTNIPIIRLLPPSISKAKILGVVV